MIDLKTFVWTIVAVSFIGFALIATPWRDIVQFRPLQRLRRAEFIRTYKFPRGLLPKLEQRHPGFTRKESALVSRGLRQFFIAYLMSGKEFVSMPSVVADDLWHEFILYTREYEAFCRQAFGGFLHHSPAIVLPDEKRSNGGLRRVWWYTCKYENIDPVNPTRLPLLFALDEKLNVPGGSLYPLESEEVAALTRGARERKSGRHSSFRAEGDSGFGDSGGADGGGGDGGGGCGGGCGGS